MGQKAHALGLRFGIQYNWNSKWYNNKNYSFFLIIDFKVKEVINDIFLTLKKYISNVKITFNNTILFIHFTLFLRKDTYREFIFLNKNIFYIMHQDVSLYTINSLFFKLWFLTYYKGRMYDYMYYRYMDYMRYVKYYSLLFFYKKKAKNNTLHISYNPYIYNTYNHTSSLYNKSRKNKKIILFYLRKVLGKHSLFFLFAFFFKKKQIERIENASLILFLGKKVLFSYFFLTYLNTIETVIQYNLNVNTKIIPKIKHRKKRIINASYHLHKLKYDLELHLPYFEVLREFKKRINKLLRTRRKKFIYKKKKYKKKRFKQKYLPKQIQYKRKRALNIKIKNTTVNKRNIKKHVTKVKVLPYSLKKKIQTKIRTFKKKKSKSRIDICNINKKYKKKTKSYKKTQIYIRNRVFKYIYLLNLSKKINNVRCRFRRLLKKNFAKKKKNLKKCILLLKKVLRKKKIFKYTFFKGHKTINKRKKKAKYLSNKNIKKKKNASTYLLKKNAKKKVMKKANRKRLNKKNVLSFLHKKRYTSKKKKQYLYPKLMGYKLSISGRTSRRNMMTRIQMYSRGAMPIQTVTAKIDFFQHVAETRLGTLGLKLWLFYKIKKKKNKINIKKKKKKYKKYKKKLKKKYVL